MAIYAAAAVCWGTTVNELWLNEQFYLLNKIKMPEGNVLSTPCSSEATVGFFSAGSQLITALLLSPTTVRCKQEQTAAKLAPDLSSNSDLLIKAL